jgi:hypothetical protein
VRANEARQAHPRPSGHDGAPGRAPGETPGLPLRPLRMPWPCSPVTLRNPPPATRSFVVSVEARRVFIAAVVAFVAGLLAGGWLVTGQYDAVAVVVLVSAVLVGRLVRSLL